tara:strand:- start:30 stop:362 length:333 start_codon:yes stop_codon:yes gene_type:complete
MKTKNLRKKIEKAIIRQELSYRGGGIEIDLTHFGYAFGKMSAYQNYLGGGILGRIQNACNISIFDWEKDKKLIEIAEELKKYMHELTNHSDDEWESESYFQNQNKPKSAY